MSNDKRKAMTKREKTVGLKFSKCIKVHLTVFDKKLNRLARSVYISAYFHRCSIRILSCPSLAPRSSHDRNLHPFDQPIDAIEVVVPRVTPAQSSHVMMIDEAQKHNKTGKNTSMAKERIPMRTSWAPVSVILDPSSLLLHHQKPKDRRNTYIKDFIFSGGTDLFRIGI